MGKRFDVSVNLTGDSKGAVGAARRTEGAMKRLGNTIKNNLAASMIGATALFYGMFRAMKSVITAANTQEDALNRVATALEAVSQASPENIKSFEDWASSLQKSTTAGDETILMMSALALSFTDSAAQAKKLTETALNFSKGAGISFEEALRRLGRSLGGAVGDIANFAPEIRNLTKEQIAAGVQVDILAEKYAGFAEKEAKTFSGRMTQLGNALGDVAERMGEGVTKNSEFSTSIADLTTFVQDNEAAFARLWVSIGEGAVAIIGGITDKFTQLGNAIGWVVVKTNELVGAYDVVEVSQSALQATADNLGITVEEVRERMEAAKHGIHEVNTETDAAADGMENLAGKIDKAGGAAQVLTDHFKNSTEAALGLGSSLGEVTSVELAVEIEKINEALEESKAKLGENSDEYVRLEAIAQEKLTNLQARIQSLRDGMGDLKTTTEEGASAFDNYAGGVDRARVATEQFASAARFAADAASAASTKSQNLIPAIGGGQREEESGYVQISGGSFTIGSGGFAPYGYHSDGRIRGGGFLSA